MKFVFDLDGTGSSPRGRGTPRMRERQHRSARFIPARAGNASPVGVSARRTPVHPRAGGERLRRSYKALSLSGSSPRGRGTQKTRPRFHQRGRFIPARAGNATKAGCGPMINSVHPRAGGERAWDSAKHMSRFGSSPRGRGTQSTTPWWSRQARFIPARAGNAGAFDADAKCEAVHPRAGGERSCQKRLIKGDIHDVKQRTGVLLMRRRRRLRLAKAYFHVRAGRRPAAGA